MGNTPNIDSNTIAKSAIEQANINSSEYRDNPNWVNDYTRLNAENVNNMRKNIYKYVKELTTQALVQENNVVKDLIEDTVGEKYPDNNSTGEIFNDYSERIVYENGSKLGNIASGEYSSARGRGTTASGKNSSAEGVETEASGHTSHAQGNNTKSLGTNNHSQGRGTVANGGYGTHAQGVNTTAMGDKAPHAEGYSTNSLYKLHPEWTWDIKNGTVPTTEDILREWEQNKFLLARGETSHSEGEDTISLGNVTHSEGKQTIAIVPYSHTEGYHTLTSKDTETSNNLVYASHSEGYNTTTDGSGAHSQGYNTTSIGKGAHSQGVSSVTAKNAGVDFKNDTKDTIKSKWSGISSYNNRFLLSRGIGAHAQGYNSLALENYSASFGKATIAMGEASEAHGNQTQALHEGSFAAGFTTITTGPNQFVVGRRNAKNTSSDALFVVGNGTNGSNHKNALEVMSDGSANLQTQGTGNNSLVINKTLNDKVSKINEDIVRIENNISNALHFKGVVNFDPSQYSGTDYIAGDVVIWEAQGEEYVYDGSKFVELGNANDFLLKTEAAETYSTKTYVDTTFLTINNAKNTYLSKSDATRDYQLKKNMVDMPNPYDVPDINYYSDKYLEASSVIMGLNQYFIHKDLMSNNISQETAPGYTVPTTSAVIQYVDKQLADVDPNIGQEDIINALSAGNIIIGSPSDETDMSLTTYGNVEIQQNLKINGEVKASEYLVDDGNGNYVALDTGVVDSSLSTTSTNAIQNKVVTNKFNEVETEISQLTTDVEHKMGYIGDIFDLNGEKINFIPSDVGDNEVTINLKGNFTRFTNHFTYPSEAGYDVLSGSSDPGTVASVGTVRVMFDAYTGHFLPYEISNKLDEYITFGTGEPTGSTPGKIYIQLFE